MRHLFIFFLTVLSISPGFFVYAEDFGAFAKRIIILINAASVFIVSLAFLVFIIGVLRFIGTAGDEKSRGVGKSLMIWGSVALFVMISVWGIVAIITTTFLG